MNNLNSFKDSSFGEHESYEEDKKNNGGAVDCRGGHSHNKR